MVTLAQGIKSLLGHGRDWPKALVPGPARCGALVFHLKAMQEPSVTLGGLQGEGVFEIYI
jgi:hypothetical protein